MDDKTYKRLFQETPRQTMIRHNWPFMNNRMTKAEREAFEKLMQELSNEKSEP